MKLTQEQIEEMRQKFLGKRISLKTEKGEEWVGVCDFLGYNSHLPSWGFQVTVSRTPIPHVKPDSINLV